MSAVAGVDGGGSGTRALVLDGQGRELGSGSGPPALVQVGRAEKAAAAVGSAVRAAAEGAGASLPLAALWCGLAGAGRAEERREVEEALARRGLADEIRVGTDAEAAFHDAFGRDEPGVLLIAGTGSIALGRSARGETVRVGGWGALLGDEGSGYWIGVEGLRAVLRAHDGREPATAMHEPLLAAAGVDGPEQLVGFMGEAAKDEIGALAPLVIAAAESGDGPARSVVDRAVRELADHAEAARRRVTGEEAEPGIVLAGGLLEPGRMLGARLAAALRQRGRRVEERIVRGERGAARKALEAVGSGGS